MAEQFISQLSRPGEFTATGTPGQAYVLVADSDGNITLEEASSGVVSSVSNEDGTLTISPTTGDVVASLTSPVAVANGGTGAANLNALAKSGANSDITSLSGLTTALSTAQGGTGSKLFSSGTATFLTAGSVAVVDTSITAQSIVVVSQTGSTPAAEEFSVVVDATVGFTIYSTNSSSAAVVNYIRVK